MRGREHDEMLKENQGKIKMSRGGKRYKNGKKKRMDGGNGRSLNITARDNKAAFPSNKYIHETDRLLY